VANGELVRHDTDAAGETWVWDEAAPMATYLVQLLIGDYRILDSEGPHGLPLVDAVLSAYVEPTAAARAGTGPMIAFFERDFGPYPFASYGVAIADSQPGLAMEDQGRSQFSSVDGLDPVVMAHELAHQWFGDAVSPGTWRDTWLNEGFATYAEWMWQAQDDPAAIEQLAAQGLGPRAFAPSSPPPSGLFDPTVYVGGASVLHALRHTVGDGAFFALLRGWAHDQFGTARTTAEFEAYAARSTGRDLREFFRTWLDTTVPPTAYP
jgi:aminopeptidase N